MSHINEPWKVVNRGDEDCCDIDAKGPDGWNGDVTIAMSIGKNSARRIVACVNACVGLETEMLASLVTDGTTLQNIMGRGLICLEQRDKLLAAAELLLSRKRPNEKNGDRRLILEIDCMGLEDSIASVKGGA